MPVVVADYDPNWPDRFDALRRILTDTLGGAALAIEHVGSTSVPGQAAKPIIDIDVALADYSIAHELRGALEAAGFRRTVSGDFADRQFYVRDEEGRRTCHLSLTYLDSETWLSHRALRERLLADEDARREYGDLKRHLAAANLDAEDYTAAKTEIIQRLAGTAWRKSPPRQPVIPRRLLLIAGTAVFALLAGIGSIAYFAETSRGADGLPDHRPIRAADLAKRPEAQLFYPGSTVVESARSDQSADSANPASAPANIDNLLATGATPSAVETWYTAQLPAKAGVRRRRALPERCRPVRSTWSGGVVTGSSST